ncbi:MAG: hypothetical protein IJW99_04285 [Clostridia bacterium]|nr:hypothetical protein [Clostridia bacterium]
MRRKKKITPICALHFIKLSYRSLLFLLACVAYVILRIRHGGELLAHYEHKYLIYGIIWLVYTVEMAFRFFPSRLESMGCQKQFKHNYRPTGEDPPQLQSWKRTLAVILVWVGLNGLIGALYYTGILDGGILILISLFYGVCDMICILFFCPFQTWFMKNRCCTVCRIYNWDFAMMFTPLVFIPNVYTWSLLGMSLLLLLRWEITLRRHPERFSDRTNACLSCQNCTEKLCHHKKQLQVFRLKERLLRRGRPPHSK